MAIPWLGMMALGGGLNLAGNIYTGIRQQQIANNNLSFQRDQLSTNMAMNIEARKANFAKFLSQNVADYGYGADLDFGRQMDAAIFDKTRGRDLDRAAFIADTKASLGLQMDPLAKEMRAGAMMRRIREDEARQRAKMSGMYGEIA